MTMLRISSLILALSLITGCGITITTGPSTPNDAPTHKKSSAAMRSYKELKVPYGHLPPVGKCKIWRQGTPPGHQKALCSCSSGLSQAGVGDWLLYRKSADVLVVKDVTSVRPLRYSENSYRID